MINLLSNSPKFSSHGGRISTEDMSLLDSYMYKSENFLLTFCVPSPFPSPRWGEGGVRGKFQIFLARIKFHILKSSSFGNPSKLGYLPLRGGMLPLLNLVVNGEITL